MSDYYSQLILAIVRGQEEIIGPIAWQQASTINGLTLDRPDHVDIEGEDKKQIVEDLILRFRDFFGQAAVEVCKESAAEVSRNMPKDTLPASLQ